MSCFLSGNFSGGGGGFGPGGMGGGSGMGMGGFGGGNFNNPAAAAALLSSGFNPAAFAAGFGSMGMGPGFGFNGMGFGGFGPGFFGGFGGFGPGGFGAGGGGGGGSSTGGGSGYGTGGAGGYGGGGRSHSTPSSYDKDSYGDVPYGMGDMKGSSVSERNPSAALPSAGAGSSSSGYEGMSNPMAAAYSQGAFPAGFGGFPGMGSDWSQFASAAGAGGAGAGVGVGVGATEYQMGNYSQMSSNYGPAGRVNSRGVGGADKNNRGYRPY